MVPDPKSYNYELPPDLIAQSHAIPRDHSKLLVVNRHTKILEDKHFFDLPQYLTSDDVLVLNETKVFPARLLGKKATGKINSTVGTSGGRVEVLLLQQLNLDTWRSISKPSLKPGTLIIFSPSFSATAVNFNPVSGEVDLTFNISGNDLLNQIDNVGIVPLPHYINTTLSAADLKSQYQTVYAQSLGSAAAPTAGLHFTTELLAKLQSQGIQIEKITLHVGLGTFQPIRPHNLSSGKLHPEKYFIDPQTSARLSEANQSGKRIISVGTTTTRALESNILLDPQKKSLTPGWHETDIFIYPPYKFNFIDSLITNFHLPQTSLLMLVSAFAQDTQFHNSLLQKAYLHAVDNHYRFYSFGDAMLIL